MRAGANQGVCREGERVGVWPVGRRAGSAEKKGHIEPTALGQAVIILPIPNVITASLASCVLRCL